MGQERFDMWYRGRPLPSVPGSDRGIRFGCHRGMPCFNACCKLEVSLAEADPYRAEAAQVAAQRYAGGGQGT